MIKIKDILVIVIVIILAFSTTENELLFSYLTPDLILILEVIIAGIIFLMAVRYVFDKTDLVKFKALGNKILTVKDYFEKNPNYNKISKKTDKGTNFAYCKLEVNDKKYEYYGCSKVSDIDEKNNIAGNTEIVGCFSIEDVRNKLPVRRLMPDLTWGKYSESKFAERKEHCCERKICAKILTDFTEKNLEGSKLSIISEMEPCIYCYDVLKIMQDKGITLNIYFNQMISEIKKIDGGETDIELLELEKKLKFVGNESIYNKGANVKK